MANGLTSAEQVAVHTQHQKTPDRPTPTFHEATPIKHTSSTEAQQHRQAQLAKIQERMEKAKKDAPAKREEFLSKKPTVEQLKHGVPPIKDVRNIVRRDVAKGIEKANRNLTQGIINAQESLRNRFENNNPYGSDIDSLARLNDIIGQIDEAIPAKFKLTSIGQQVESEFTKLISEDFQGQAPENSDIALQYRILAFQHVMQQQFDNPELVIELYNQGLDQQIQTLQNNSAVAERFRSMFAQADGSDPVEKFIKNVNSKKITPTQTEQIVGAVNALQLQTNNQKETINEGHIPEIEIPNEVGDRQEREIISQDINKISEQINENILGNLPINGINLENMNSFTQDDIQDAIIKSQPTSKALINQLSQIETYLIMITNHLINYQKQPSPQRDQLGDLIIVQGKLRTLRTAFIAANNSLFEVKAVPSSEAPLAA